jgi:hypothetical protein
VGLENKSRRNFKDLAEIEENSKYVKEGLGIFVPQMFPFLWPEPLE